MNEENIKSLIEKIIREVGEDPGREGLKETPLRVAKSYQKLFEGYEKDPQDLLTVFDSESYDEMIMVRDIDFYSTCEHHLLPFFGKAYVAYIPDKKIIGLSKLPRLVDIYARRMQNQERMTKQIAESLDKLLKPKGVGVYIEAQHFCMLARGVEKQNCNISTTMFTGIFRKDPRTRNEFLSLIKKKSA